MVVSDYNEVITNNYKEIFYTIDDMKHGKYMKYIINIGKNKRQRLLVECYYVSGELHGTYIEYHANGRIKQITHHVNGNKTGKILKYYYTGVLKAHGTMYNNQLVGKYIRYYRIGQILSIEYYKNNNRHGEYKSYYSNGSLHKLYWFKRGLKNGTCTTYMKSRSIGWYTNNVFKQAIYWCDLLHGNYSRFNKITKQYYNSFYINGIKEA